MKFPYLWLNVLYTGFPDWLYIDLLQAALCNCADSSEKSNPNLSINNFDVIFLNYIFQLNQQKSFQVFTFTFGPTAHTVSSVQVIIQTSTLYLSRITITAKTHASFAL